MVNENPKFRFKESVAQICNKSSSPRDEHMTGPKQRGRATREREREREREEREREREREKWGREHNG